MNLVAAIPSLFAGSSAAAGATAAGVGGAAAGAAAGGGGLLSSLAMVGSAVGTGISAFSQIQAGRAAYKSGKAANQVAEQRARQAELESQERTSRMRDENRRRLSAMRARMASSGTTIAGSALDFLGESARRLETRVQDEARRASLDAANERFGGQVALWEGGEARRSSSLRGFGTLLEGVGSFYNQGVKHGKFGPPGGTYRTS